jgi:hypothetical protein
VIERASGAFQSAKVGLVGVVICDALNVAPAAGVGANPTIAVTTSVTAMLHLRTIKPSRSSLYRRRV